MELNGKFSKEEMQIAMKYFPIALFCFFPLLLFKLHIYINIP